MARDPKYDILFEPIKLGPKTMKNRFYQIPHCNGFGSEKPLSQAFFRSMKAEGGYGACCTEYCSISPESDDTHRVSARLWDDDDVTNLSVMCEMLHGYGALAAAELWYGGPHAPCMESRCVPRAPSQIPSDFEHLTYPKQMDKDDIRAVQKMYVDAAKRARTAGFDIVYVYGSHSYLPQQFLTPYYNKRTDEYGGSFVNRARFWRETIEQVKEAVGHDTAIAVRMSCDMFMGEPGTQLERDCLPFVELVDDIVDVWDINVSGISEWGEDATPSRFYPSGRMLPWQQAVKKVSKKPVLGVGRFTNPDLMIQAINGKQLDIIATCRPSIADPWLPKKIDEGRLDDIRECIGCNVCISRWEIGGPPVICTQNATAGEEYRRGWHPEIFTKAKNADNDVLVIGAGPAGMECAMILGKRGMRRVHLVEAQDDMGGIMRWISQLPGLGEWGRIVNYRKIQINKLKNVEFVPNTRLDANAITTYGAEIVIVATGGYWATDGLNGATHDIIPGADASLAWQLTPEQIMAEGKKVPGKKVLIVDNDGYFMGVSLAEKLAMEGKKVTIMSHQAHIAKYMDFTLESPNQNRKLHKLGVEIVVEHYPTKIEEGKVHAVHVFDEEAHDRVWETDAVVLVTQRRSNEALYRELKDKVGFAAMKKEGVNAVYRIGDCVAPRLIADAIFDAHRLAREIDSANPEEPLPYKRERRVINMAGARAEIDQHMAAIHAGVR
ncbi:MAG TPA: FAD-dependent oxidoreductase [Candidatus Dormibacteraeota bacterium]|nr:FAD-dependent oxidoreductase [Candidatus Dormibacteraeota bacterium]